MLGILFFVITLTFGWVLVGQLPLQLTRAERLAAATVMGIFVSSWLLFLLGWLVNFSVAVPVAAGLQTIVSLVLWRRDRLQHVHPHQPSQIWQRQLLIVLALLLGLFFAYLCYTHALQVYPDGWYGSGYTWSDLPLHMTLISNVAFQKRFEFVFPVYYVAKLSYPFLVDVYSGILLRLGLSWQLTIFLPTLALLLSLVQLFLALTQRLLGSIRAAWIHLLLFLGSGSAWGLVLYIQDGLTTGWNSYLNNDYTNLQATRELYFANIVTSHLFPQRGFLFGFTLALFILLLLWHAYKKAEGKRMVLWAMGLCIGLLPFAHTHTFFILAGLVGLITIHDMIRVRGWRTPWLTALIILTVVAFPQVAWQFTSTYTSNFGRWYFGWGRGEDTSVVIFWLRNFGLALPFLFLDYWVLQRFIKDRIVWFIYALSLLIFVAINVRIFQPSVFDNMKFLVYGYWGISLIISYLLAKWSRNMWGMVATVLILVSMCGSGVLALARETTLHWPEFSTEELQFAKDFQTLVPPEAKVLTTDRHNHPIPTLTGRKILLGYQGWLWSYGIDASAVAQDVRNIFIGTPYTEALLRKYQVDYIVFSSQEVLEQGINLSYFQITHPLVYHNEGWYVFSAQPK